MDEVIDRLLVQVRADTGAFGKDVDVLRGQMGGPLVDGAEKAGRMIEGALLRAVRTGKFGFEDMKRVALSVLAEIAASAISSGIGGIGGGAGGGLVGAGVKLLGGLLGAPGRATGGPVSAGRAYRVGENGPEWFTPGAEGRIAAAGGGGGGGGREVRVAISINAPAGSAPDMLARSSKQVARAVRGAMERAG
ncbi:tail tape measure protein [Aquisediminimonas sediminicola]|uniref:tail tape measure protein n=1 Tax=Alteraquisediminimonas sediminicola TaxID=2676787 RepID=UPI001C8E1359|nr:tail tape measure protein [Aquisediminimonas sediminicola]